MLPMNKRQYSDTHFELLNMIAKGDEYAFRQLYDQIHDNLFFFIYRMVRDKEMAEDVHVEVFTEVWRSAKKFKGQSKVKTWIFGIARNLSMNALRNQKKHLNIDDVENTYMNESTEYVDESAGNRQVARKSIIKEALLTISLKHREILDLVFFHEMNYQEISELLNIPLNTVKTRVFYAKQALRKSFKKMGIKDNGLYA